MLKLTQAEKYAICVEIINGRGHVQGNISLDMREPINLGPQEEPAFISAEWVISQGPQVDWDGWQTTASKDGPTGQHGSAHCLFSVKKQFSSVGRRDCGSALII